MPRSQRHPFLFDFCGLIACIVRIYFGVFLEGKIPAASSDKRVGK